MIQRKQTIWLLLTAVAAFVYTQVPLYNIITNAGEALKFSAAENLLLFALSIAIGLLAAAAIFLFKNRPTQLRLTIISLLASIGLIALQVMLVSSFKSKYVLAKASYAWGSLLPIVMIILLIMAISGIRSDQKLVKSLDRLR